jgi:dTDP-4-dehydrorhamnose reductase
MLGVQCAARGIRVLHVSTDYVFDGGGRTKWREGDVTNPQSWYGVTKRDGEQALQASGAMHCIVRTQWLFGPGGRSFPRTMWERASRGDATRVVNDQWGRPTFTPDLAAALWMLVGAETEGVVHVANAGEATWYAVAQRVFASLHREALLTPCTTAEYPVAATRPVYGVLDLSHVHSLGIVLPPWEQGIDRFLSTLRATL